MFPKPGLPPAPRVSQEYKGSVCGVSTSPDPSLAHSVQSSPGPGIGAQLVPDSHNDIEIGRTVFCNHGGLLFPATVRYIGCLPLQGEKIYVGMELPHAGTY